MANGTTEKKDDVIIPAAPRQVAPAAQPEPYKTPRAPPTTESPEKLGLSASPGIGPTAGEFTPDRVLGAKQYIYLWDTVNLQWVGLDGQDKGDLKRKTDQKQAKDKDNYPDSTYVSGFKDWSVDFSGDWIIDLTSGIQGPGIKLAQGYWEKNINPVPMMLVTPGPANSYYVGNVNIAEWDLMGPVDGYETYSGSLQGTGPYVTYNM